MAGRKRGHRMTLSESSRYMNSDSSDSEVHGARSLTYTRNRRLQHPIHAIHNQVLLTCKSMLASSWVCYFTGWWFVSGPIRG